MTISEILQLKFPTADLLYGVVIQDDGLGPYIAKWDNALGKKPTQVDLDRWAVELVPIKAAKYARENRRNEYPAIGDQLDMIYKAMDSGLLTKVPEFYNSIKVVKDKYPL